MWDAVHSLKDELFEEVVEAYKAGRPLTPTKVEEIGHKLSDLGGESLMDTVKMIIVAKSFSYGINNNFPKFVDFQDQIQNIWSDRLPAGPLKTY